PENSTLKILKIETCPGWEAIENSPCLVVTAICKSRWTFNTDGRLFGPRLTRIDKNGIPDATYQDDYEVEDTDIPAGQPQPPAGPPPGVLGTMYDFKVDGSHPKECLIAGEILKYYLPRPSVSYTFTVDLPKQ
ncbi:MAG TPA: hypothetical protein VL359_15220, partial [bacterium]|nr:hypothetical protein [bacterium]